MQGHETPAGRRVDPRAPSPFVPRSHRTPCGELTWQAMMRHAHPFDELAGQRGRASPSTALTRAEHRCAATSPCRVQESSAARERRRRTAPRGSLTGTSAVRSITAHTEQLRPRSRGDPCASGHRRAYVDRGGRDMRQELDVAPPAHTAGCSRELPIQAVAPEPSRGGVHNGHVVAGEHSRATLRDALANERARGECIVQHVSRETLNDVDRHTRRAPHRTLVEDERPTMGDAITSVASSARDRLGARIRQRHRRCRRTAREASMQCAGCGAPTCADLRPIAHRHSDRTCTARVSLGTGTEGGGGLVIIAHSTVCFTCRTALRSSTHRASFIEASRRACAGIDTRH